MWIKKLKRKKLQFALIGIILLFAASIFSACLCFYFEMNHFSESVYDKGNCPDVFLDVAKPVSAELLSSAQNSSEFKKVFSVDGVILKENARNITRQNGKMLTSLSLYAVNDASTLPWKVLPVQNSTKEAGPRGKGIWVTKVYADTMGIRLGDTLVIQNAQKTVLKVTALVNDASCPSVMFGIYPFYVSGGTLNSLSGETAVTHITLSDRKDYGAAEDWIEKQPSTVLSGVLLNFNISQLKMTFSMFTMILGGIGLLAALIIFAVSIIIIRFLIKSSLIKEFRSIGIYKAMGFENSEIRGFYFRCYLAVGIVGIAIGTAAGVPLGSCLGAFVTKYLSGFALTWRTPVGAVSGALLLLLLLCINLWLAYRRIDRITPVQALQIGTTNSRRKLSRSLIPHAKGSFSMAINGIFKHKSFSIMFVLVLTASFYLAIVFASVQYSCAHIGDNLYEWFGYPTADAIISGGNITDPQYAFIKKLTIVTDSARGTTVADIKLKSAGALLRDSAVICWSKLADTAFFPGIRAGRMPQNGNEIALSGNTAAGKAKIGDYLTVTIGSKEKSLLVTGIYDCMMHAGKTMMLTTGAFNGCGISGYQNAVVVRLKAPSDLNTLKKRVQAAYPALSVTKIIDMQGVGDDVSGVVNVMNPVTGTLVAIFILFSVLNIINLLLTEQLDSRRRFGILKSLGFTSGYICRQSICRTLILSIVSAALALGLNDVVSSRIFYAMLTINGFITSPSQLCVLLGSIFACIIAVTLLFCIPLRHIAPVELMDE